MLSKNSHRTKSDMDLEFMKEILMTYRPTGYEVNASSLLLKAAKNINEACQVTTDKMWNSFVCIGSEKNDAKTILISGHSDQNCLIVTGITNNGFLRIMQQGGISPKTIIDSDVVVLADEGNRKIHGFCSYKAIHIESPDERKKCPEIKDLYIDIGCETKEQAIELGVRIGDIAVFDNSGLNMDFGHNGKYIVGSGIDDGIACGIAYDVFSHFCKNIEILKENNIRLCCAFISSEETGARGVHPIVKKIDPDISIDIDVCHDCTKEIGTDDGRDIRMGDGVVICFGPDKYRPLNSALIKIAEDNSISYQRMAGKAGGTNTNMIQQMSSNCETTLLGIPCRYMHSSTHEMVNKDDIECCEKLICKFIETVK